MVICPDNHSAFIIVLSDSPTKSSPSMWIKKLYKDVFEGMLQCFTTCELVIHNGKLTGTIRISLETKNAVCLLLRTKEDDNGKECW